MAVTLLWVYQPKHNIHIHGNSSGGYNVATSKTAPYTTYPYTYFSYGSTNHTYLLQIISLSAHNPVAPPQLAPQLFTAIM